MADPVATGISLKDANAGALLAVLALNVAAFYLLQKSSAIGAGDWMKLATGWLAALPAGVGVALVGILNAQVSADMKARLVFWRWQNPLPGSQAFTRHGRNDPRVDMAALEAKHGPLPTDPKAQNALWYKMYRAVADEPAVTQAHRQFLFARDYTFVALAILVVLGATAFKFIHPISTAEIYALLLMVQWGLATRAANLSGHRFVSTVLAQKGART